MPAARDGRHAADRRGDCHGKSDYVYYFLLMAAEKLAPKHAAEAAD